MNYPNYYQGYQQPMYGQPMGQLEQLRQQTYQPQYQQQTQQQSAMVWVRNRFEAENYPVAPNTAIALWDASGPYVHRKEADVSGKPVLKTFQLVEVTDTPQTVNVPNGDFITRQEFQPLVDAVAALTAKKEVTANE